VDLQLGIAHDLCHPNGALGILHQVRVETSHRAIERNPLVGIDLGPLLITAGYDRQMERDADGDCGSERNGDADCDADVGSCQSNDHSHDQHRNQDHWADRRGSHDFRNDQEVVLRHVGAGLPKNVQEQLPG